MWYNPSIPKGMGTQEKGLQEGCTAGRQQEVEEKPLKCAVPKRYIHTPLLTSYESSLEILPYFCVLNFN